MGLRRCHDHRAHVEEYSCSSFKIESMFWSQPPTTLERVWLWPIEYFYLPFFLKPRLEMYNVHIGVLQSASSIIIVSQSFLGGLKSLRRLVASTAGELKSVISSTLSTGASANAIDCQTHGEIFLNPGCSQVFGSSEKQYIPQQMVVTRGTPYRNNTWYTAGDSCPLWLAATWIVNHI